MEVVEREVACGTGDRGVLVELLTAYCASPAVEHISMLLLSWGLAQRLPRTTGAGRRAPEVDAKLLKPV